MPQDIKIRPATLSDIATILRHRRSMYEDMKAQRDKWETVAQRLALPAPKPSVETPETPAKPESEPKQGWWAWLRSTG